MRQLCISLLVAAVTLFSTSARADGCFVFKWNKAIDINEPTQKAIIVHDAGREDLLLQVKYEGPLEEFGWLIPVPSLPKVEKGSMEPFYELSQLTQRQFGGGTKGLATLGAANDSSGESVKVIETKTVGAYEISVLAAKDSDGLARWLRAHDYSLPEGKSDIVEDYIRRGWYSIAAKIELNKGVAFKMASTTSPGDSGTPTKARKSLQKKLASGELHPLLISFDTPKCVFPLKISAMNGRPSEVSLYVLSKEPLLEKFTFAKACEKLQKNYGEWAAHKAQRAESEMRSVQNMRTMQIATMMYSESRANRFSPPDRRPKNWSTEDLNALARENLPQLRHSNLYDVFGDGFPEELLHQMRLESSKIPKCSRVLPRLKGRDWQLTKVVWTFTPAEMEDLEFEAAIPALARVVPEGFGTLAVQLLARFGDAALPALVASCKSTNSLERLNAVGGLERSYGRAQAFPPTEVWLALLRDGLPGVRVHAARFANSHWDQRFTQPMIELLRDPNFEVRQDASWCLAVHESTNRTAFYLSLLADPDPNVRAHALGIAASLNRRTPSDEVTRAMLHALKDPSEDVQSSALMALVKNHQPIPKTDLFPLLNNSRGDTASYAANLLRWGGRFRYVSEPTNSTPALSSTEAATLITNKFGNVRLVGLRVLQENADAKAVELTLPLLRDPNSVIRSRAFVTLQAISGQNISDNDPAKWEAWWAANKATSSPCSASP